MMPIHQTVMISYILLLIPAMVFAQTSGSGSSTTNPGPVVMLSQNSWFVDTGKGTNTIVNPHVYGSQFIRNGLVQLNTPGYITITNLGQQLYTEQVSTDSSGGFYLAALDMHSPSTTGIYWLDACNILGYSGLSGSMSYGACSSEIPMYFCVSNNAGGCPILTATWPNGGTFSMGLPSNNLSVPQPPTGLKASLFFGSINLSWNAPSNTGGSPINGYVIMRSTDGGSTWYTLTANTGTTATKFSDVELIPDTTYTYQVLAINSVGTSDPSNIASQSFGTQSGVIANGLSKSYNLVLGDLNGTCEEIGGKWTTSNNTCTSMQNFPLGSGDGLTIANGVTWSINNLDSAYGIGILNGVTIINSGNIINKGEFWSTGGTITNYGTITNFDNFQSQGVTNTQYGTIINSGNFQNIGAVPINNAGTIINNNAATMSISYLSNTGTINNNAGGSIIISNTATNNNEIINNGMFVVLCGGTISGNLIQPNNVVDECYKTAQITNGGASIDEISQMGDVSVNISGSSSPDGTNVSLTSIIYGIQQPVGIANINLSSVGFFDVKIYGIIDGTATICISNSNVVSGQSIIEYWTGTQWLSATNLQYPNSNTVCGDVPVSDLTKTPIALGIPSSLSQTSANTTSPTTLKVNNTLNSSDSLYAWVAMISVIATSIVIGMVSIKQNKARP